MAEKKQNNATSPAPSGSVSTSESNTPRHTLIAMGQSPKGTTGGGSKPGA